MKIDQVSALHISFGKAVVSMELFSASVIYFPVRGCSDGRLLDNDKVLAHYYQPYHYPLYALCKHHTQFQLLISISFRISIVISGCSGSYHIPIWTAS